MEELSNTTGLISGLLFIAANAYYPARLIAKRFTLWTRETAVFFSKYLRLHITLNLAALLFMIIHAHYAEEKTMLLRFGSVITILLTIEGLVMHYRLLPEHNRYMRLLHTQQALFYLWIVIIIIGHIRVI